jgi:integrase
MLSWGVDVPAYLSPNNRPVRRFFLTLREAKEFGAHMRRQWDDHTHDSTYLSRDQLSEAARAYAVIAEMAAGSGVVKSYSLLGIVEDWAARQRQSSKSVTLEQLFDEYIKARADKSPKYLYQLRWTRGRLVSLGHRMVSTITAGDLESALRQESPYMRNTFMTYLRAMMRWGIKKGYLTDNPVARMEFTQIKRQEAQIYTPDDVQQLLDDCMEHDLRLLPYRVLTLFCGIRPSGEVTRVDWSDIKWTDRVVKLQSGITKKGRSRFPRLSDNAMAWLQAYKERIGQMEGLVVPYSRNQLERAHRANLERSGVRGIKNGSRHSYCSYHLAKYEDIDGLTLQSGHANTDVLWRHYYQAATKEDAERYWSIVPKAAATNVVAFNAS